jgi:Secretion system C-terminal sorting domain
MKKLFFILYLVAFLTDLKAAHIVGGEMSYTLESRQNNVNRYRFELKVYRDMFSMGAPFDAFANLTIYQKDTIFRIFRSPLVTQDTLALPPISWLMLPSNIGVEVGSYFWTIDLPISNSTYNISYQRCCRNATIQNILNPSTTGATYSVEITPESQRLGNSSPVFNPYPPILICAQEPINVLQNATDGDGDRLIYRLCAAFSGASLATPLPATNTPPPFALLDYRGPHTATEPITGTPPLSIDSLTGRLTGKPDMLGQFIVTVCVEEYRNNVLLGKVYRDFQFNVVACQSPPLGGLSTPVLLLPQLNSALAAYNNLKMSWTSVPNATAYLFEISQLTNFGDAFQFVTTGPEILLTNDKLLGFLKPNQQYFWRIKAFRAGEISGNYSVTFAFTTGILNKSSELNDLNDFSILPNPLSNSAYFSVQMTCNKAFNAAVTLTNSAGQVLLSEKHFFETGANQIPIFINQLPNGIYIVGVGTDKGVSRKKLVVQH